MVKIKISNVYFTELLKLNQLVSDQKAKFLAIAEEFSRDIVQIDIRTATIIYIKFRYVYIFKSGRLHEDNSRSGLSLLIP